MPDPMFREGESWKTGSAGKRERMMVYVEWLLSPISERNPSTLTELASLLGVSLSTLRNYRNDPWLQREMATRSRAEARIERLPDILGSLYDQAIDRDNPRSVAAARTYLEFLKDSEEARTVENLEELSDEDLLRVLNTLLKRQTESETA